MTHLDAIKRAPDKADSIDVHYLLYRLNHVERALLVAWRAGDFSRAGTEVLEELVLAVQDVEGKS